MLAAWKSNPHAVGAVHFELMRHGVAAAARAHIDDLRQMQLPRVAKALPALADFAVDMHGIGGQTLFAEHGLHQSQHRRMGNHRVAGRGASHQSADPPRTAQAVQTMRRCVDVRPHLGDHASAIGGGNDILHHHESMPIQSFPNIGVEAAHRPVAGRRLAVVETPQLVFAESVYGGFAGHRHSTPSTRFVSAPPALCRARSRFRPEWLDRRWWKARRTSRRPPTGESLGAESCPIASSASAARPRRA